MTSIVWKSQYDIISVEFAGVTKLTIKCGDNALICDGGATSTLTNRLTIVYRSNHKW